MDLKYSNIVISDKLKDKLEREGILYEHITRVIESAEKFDNKIIIAGKARFIGHLRIGTVTFWVEYAPYGNKYLIHNSYCHRIQVQEGS